MFSPKFIDFSRIHHTPLAGGRYPLTMDRKIIGIACNGEGFGHAARAAALYPHLQEHHDVIFFAPQTIAPFIRQHVEEAAVVDIPHFGFVKKDHAIDYPSTAKENLKKIIESLPRFNELARGLKELGVKALISDFEPVTAHAANRAGIPVINLNHPGVVLKYLDLSVDALLAKAVASLMMPPAGEHLLCSFYDGDIGPILRRELREAEPVRGDHILVYTKSDSREAVHTALGNYPALEFRCFPDPGASYDEALITCRAVIAPAGHQALSEALCLGKAVLAFPQIGQFEQRLNAVMLERSGWGLAGDIMDIKGSIDRFLSCLDEFPRPSDRKVTFTLHDDTQEAARKLLAFIDGHAGMRKPYIPKLRLLPA